MTSERNDYWLTQDTDFIWSEALRTPEQKPMNYKSSNHRHLLDTHDLHHEAHYQFLLNDLMHFYRYLLILTSQVLRVFAISNDILVLRAFLSDPSTPNRFEVVSGSRQSK